jgi:anti-sigma factor RsiW
MSCGQYWDEAAGEEERARHLAGCEECAAAARLEATLRAHLRALAAGSRHEQAPARVEARLRAAFREQQRPVRVRFRWPVLGWTGAAAAVLVALLISRSGSVTMAAEAPVSAIEEQLYADGGFVPVPNAPRIRAGEEVNLVQIEVAPTVIAALGIPLASGNEESRVVAEFALGGDGLPRAVRLLN